jgi:hypothetical protein
MGIRYFAFVVGEDVSTVFAVDDEQSYNKAVIAGLRSGPVIIETDESQVSLGWKYRDGEFLPPFLGDDEGPGYEIDD